jgi:hypothetical protein
MARTRINRLFQKIPVNIPNLTAPKTIEVRYMCGAGADVGVFRVERFKAQLENNRICSIPRSESSDLAFVVGKVIRELEELAITWTQYYKKFPLEFDKRAVYREDWVANTDILCLKIGQNNKGIQYSKSMNGPEHVKVRCEISLNNLKKFDEDIHNKFVLAIEKVKENYRQEFIQLTNKYEQLWIETHNKVFYGHDSST